MDGADNYFTKMALYMNNKRLNRSANFNQAVDLLWFGFMERVFEKLF